MQLQFQQRITELLNQGSKFSRDNTENAYWADDIAVGK